MTTDPGARNEDRREMIAWVAGLGAVSASALARLQGRSVASAQARLAAAERHGLLASQRQLRDQSRLYTVTRAGLGHCDARRLQPTKVSAAGFHHSVVCCEVAAELCRSFPQHRLLGEPAMRAQERESGTSLSVELRGTAAGATLHRPDLVLLDRASRTRPVAVEVELTVKAPRRLRAICRAWARSARIAGVLYIVAAEVESPLRRAIEDAGAGGAIALLRVDELLDRDSPRRTIASAA